VKEQDTRGIHVWLILMKAYQACSARSSESLRNPGLGDSDFRVLEVLLHKGPLPVNVIGPKVNLTPGSISVAVDRLYQRGLVSREDTPEDRRIRIVALTTEGRKLITRVFKAHEADMEQVVAPLSEAERVQLMTLLKKLGKHAAELKK
jgi:MarR family transcriptional regulator, 2-MHQ and catechol-resistance regulon repressor